MWRRLISGNDGGGDDSGGQCIGTFSVVMVHLGCPGRKFVSGSMFQLVKDDDFTV